MTANTSTHQGLFIVIEGSDGSGKATQCSLLAERLQREGYQVASFDFPQYDESSSYFVREYLNGKYGGNAEVSAYTGSLFYALDRFHASVQIQQALSDGKIVLANRFTGSSMAHQGAKLQHAEERRGYFIWLDTLEHQMLGVPRPDMNFILRVPADIAQQLVDKKPKRQYTESQRDIHEADIDHLRKSVEVFDEMSSLFPKDYTTVDCIKGQKLLSIEDVHSKLWKNIKPLLSTVPKNTAATPPVHTTATNPYLSKDNNGYYVVTVSGQAFLDEAVTNANGDVYAFKDTLSPLTIAAAMARLSRRGDDMRVTILDEFTGKQGKDEKLLQRVITAYGDDSVQQLVGMHLVVENASNLLTKKLEWGRLAAYLEQSTRYIYFDQKKADGSYKYHVPSHFDEATKDLYCGRMNAIFNLYSKMVHGLTDHISKTSTTPENERDGAWRSAVRAQACDAIRAVLPVATQSTVGIYASGQAVESLIMHLLSDDLPEARQAGQDILREARKVIPTFLERADRPDRGGAAIAYRANTFSAVQKLAKAELPASYSTPTDAVTLTDFWPRNEIDIVADILYEHSSLPLQEIRAEVEGWDYNKKHQAFKTAIGERLNRRHKPGRAFEKPHYSWDLLCDYGIFRDIQRHRMVDDMNWQQLTPRYGYEVPALVEEAGLSDDFERCFDLSLELHSKLQAAGYELEAQYATLLGHRMRCKMTYNAREAFHLHELRTSPQGHPGYRKLVQEMHEKLAQVHPLMADAMIFVNKGEDEELSRLAAERYTQYKLKNLG
jgi:thymidylate kinase/thymidylate synthase ThyX